MQYFLVASTHNARALVLQGRIWARRQPHFWSSIEEGSSYTLQLKPVVARGSMQFLAIPSSQLMPSFGRPNGK